VKECEKKGGGGIKKEEDPGALYLAIGKARRRGGGRKNPRWRLSAGGGGNRKAPKEMAFERTVSTTNKTRCYTAGKCEKERMFRKSTTSGKIGS